MREKPLLAIPIAHDTGTSDPSSLNFPRPRPGTDLSPERSSVSPSNQGCTPPLNGWANVYITHEYTRALDPQTGFNVMCASSRALSNEKQPCTNYDTSNVKNSRGLEPPTSTTLPGNEQTVRVRTAFQKRTPCSCKTDDTQSTPYLLQTKFPCVFRQNTQPHGTYRATSSNTIHTITLSQEVLFRLFPCSAGFLSPRVREPSGSSLGPSIWILSSLHRVRRLCQKRSTSDVTLRESLAKSAVEPRVRMCPKLHRLQKEALGCRPPSVGDVRHRPTGALLGGCEQQTKGANARADG